MDDKIIDKVERELKYIQSSFDNILLSINELLITLKENGNTVYDNLTLYKVLKREKQILKFGNDHLVQDIKRVIECLKEPEIEILESKIKREMK